LPIPPPPEAMPANERVAAALRLAPPPPPPLPFPAGPPPPLVEVSPDEPDYDTPGWWTDPNAPGPTGYGLAVIRPPRPARMRRVAMSFALSLVFPLFGPVCWERATEELRGMDYGFVDPRGRRWLAIAQIWGAVLTFTILSTIGFALPFLLM
jgi:hypothetical protein